MTFVPSDVTSTPIPDSNTDDSLYLSTSAPAKAEPKAVPKDHKIIDPPEQDTTSGLVGGGGPVMGFDQAYRFLGGEPLSSIEGAIGRTNQKAQGNQATFQQQAMGGAPMVPFGGQQAQTIEAGLQGNATEQQQQSVADLLGTTYTGPEQMAEDTPTAGTAGALGRSVTQGFGSGQQYGGMLGEGTSGEKREEAARFIGDPKGRAAVQKTQQAADRSYRMLSDIGAAEQPLVEGQKQKAQAMVGAGRDYLQGAQDQAVGRTETEMARINENNAIAEAAMQRFRDTDDLEELRGAPPGYVDPAVFGLAQTPTARMGREAKAAWQGIWDSPEFSTIVNVPLMRRTVSGQGYESHNRTDWSSDPGNNSMRLDPNWIANNMHIFSSISEDLPDVGGRGGHENNFFASILPNQGEISRSGTGMSIIMRYMLGYNWLPGSTDLQGSKRSRGEHRADVPGWEHFNEEQKQAIHQLRNTHRKAKERQGDLRNAGFGRGGGYEVYRPIDGFGFVRQWNPMKYAGYVSDLITKQATLENTMSLSDKTRFNAAANFLGSVQSIYEAGGDADSIPEPLYAKMDEMLAAEELALSNRANTLDRNQLEWQRLVRRVRGDYRSERDAATLERVIGLALVAITAGAAMSALMVVELAATLGPWMAGVSVPTIPGLAATAGAVGAGAAGLEYTRQQLAGQGIDLTTEEIQALVRSAQSVGMEMSDNLEGTVELGGEWSQQGRQYRAGDAVIYDRAEREEL